MPLFALTQRFWSWVLPSRRNYAAPWTGVDVLIVFFLTEFFWATMLGALLNYSGFFEALFGEDFQRILDEQATTPEGILTLNRWRLWVSVIAFPFNLATLLVVPRLLSETRLYQVGLTRHRLGRNIFIGVVGWAFITPTVLGLNEIVRKVYVLTTHSVAKENVLAGLGRSHPPALEMALIVVSAVIVAPVLEEVVYRGLLQRWLSRQPWGGLLAWSLSFGLAVVYSIRPMRTAWGAADWAGFEAALQPPAFVLALLPVLWLIGRGSSPQAARALLGTSLLFAIRHVQAWPDPVALFLLALCLGWLANRTRSLVGPIVLHSLFNGVGCVMMIWS
jgi:membrane protease YdiL (CAAX protease family)